MTDSAEVLWRPSAEQVAGSRVADFQRWLAADRGLEFDSYLALQRWSARHPAEFWGALWDYFGLDRVSGYEEVLPRREMPGARWFSGARLNFAERCLARPREDRPAVISLDERGEPVETSWADLRREVAAVAGLLRAHGVEPGDHVAAYLPNVREAVVGLLATAAVGAVWTACSPDFGTASVLARFQQVEPVVLLAGEGYVYGGKAFDRRPQAAELLDGLPSVRHLLVTGGDWPERAGLAVHAWPAPSDEELVFADTAFDDALWVLWSSGTTGVPKGIVQGHGGIVLELLKSVGLCADVGADDRFGFVTSTSWMVWNYLVGGLLHGSTIVLYDGSPTHPDVDQAWRVAELTGTTVLGVGAGYVVAGEKSGSRPGSRFDLTGLRSVLQTGSTMPPPAWRWVYSHVGEHIWLQSICGGTDVCSALAGGAADLPVHTGRIPAPALGVALASWGPDGKPLLGEQGELVVTEPLPSMPLRFVNDPGGERYRASYFDTYPGSGATATG
ncbi:acetoacetate--CoA ligase [Actinokineospora sp. G85]|uniref:acetoacetate--CoA ligase n=1 Tax=Actinokineospora sp. G85 TaxID=3406626 RepID=UPI003C717998